MDIGLCDGHTTGASGKPSDSYRAPRVKPVRVGFVLVSHSRRPLSSTRIAILNMFPYLRAADYEPVISFEPADTIEEPDVSGVADRLHAEGIDVAVFQKVHGPSVLAEVGRASAKGIRTIYAVCDFVDNAMAKATDATIVVTDFLKSLYDPRLQHKIHVVHDGIERPEVSKHDYGITSDRSGSRRLRAVLVTGDALAELPVIGDPPDFVDVTVIGRYPRTSSVLQRAKQTYWKVRSAGSNPERLRMVRRLVRKRFASLPWDFDTVHRLMASADIGIIPVDMQDDPLPGLPVSPWQVKSENRLTMMMAAGLPVIASPVPSYLPLIEHGRNGFIAATRSEWVECLKELRDPRLRQKIGRKARASVLHRFSKEEQARKLMQVLKSLT